MALTENEYQKLIDEIDVELDKKYRNEKYEVEKYQNLYNSSLEKYSKNCLICVELENQNLPYDCLSKPVYCVKNNYDFEIIIKYEELTE
ncbi:hypothetical protein [Paenimyroides aestuarii]|uniref:Uncharacterized protein n=1 Tax=Paenimyroides aestuarii TaxID=2968490 RepID=A0ABY5NQC9_9FLAO|nr:hypothetical protein [Paenimyroides aestuarii]UUV20770.1 hypothetical protein NPX36_10630 [Paenimyroides aestuarii]